MNNFLLAISNLEIFPLIFGRKIKFLIVELKLSMVFYWENIIEKLAIEEESEDTRE